MQEPQFAPPAERRQRNPVILWLLGIGGFFVLSCCGCGGFFVWAIARGPDITVYSGRAVPERFVDTMRDVGALEPDETLLFFYSEALLDIKSSFSYVSDRKVVYYSDSLSPALAAVTFDEVDTVELFRDESFFIDSELVLNLEDGTVLSFPVSSDNDGDVRFADAIKARVGPQPPPDPDASGSP